MILWLLAYLTITTCCLAVVKLDRRHRERTDQVPPIEAARTALLALGAWPPVLEPDARRALHELVEAYPRTVGDPGSRSGVAYYRGAALDARPFAALVAAGLATVDPYCGPRWRATSLGVVAWAEQRGATVVIDAHGADVEIGGVWKRCAGNMLTPSSQRSEALWHQASAADLRVVTMRSIPTDALPHLATSERVVMTSLAAHTLPEQPPITRHDGNYPRIMPPSRPPPPGGIARGNR